MVAKITTPLSITRALNYNEQKVKKGKAKCLFAGNFLQQVNELNFYQKLERFQNLIQQNTSRTNTLHISLNFHPRENPAKEKLIAIAETYMHKIGFGVQPFLVYEHFDAAHPHLHVVTTNIMENGKRIDTYNIGRNQSEKARKEIEKAYGLMKAGDRSQDKKEKIEAVKVQSVQYGIAEAKTSIANVLRVILQQYHYTSLPELNAILGLYNIQADRGKEDSRTYKNRGLHYSLLDEKGNKTGVPIKASALYCKPTLAFLKQQFERHLLLRKPFQSKLRTSIDWVLSRKPGSLEELALMLQKEKVKLIVRKNEQGFIYGLTFIDHRSKAVFNGSDLGKKYSAAAIKERIKNNQEENNISDKNLLGKKPVEPTESTKFNASSSPYLSSQKFLKDPKIETNINRENLLSLLMQKESNDLAMAFGFMRKKKKQRKPKR